MGLIEILEEVKKSGNYEFHSTYTINQSLTDIKKHIIEVLPKERSKKRYSLACEEDIILLNQHKSWNAYRQKAIKAIDKME